MNILSKKVKIVVLAFAMCGLIPIQRVNAIGFSDPLVLEAVTVFKGLCRETAFGIVLGTVFTTMSVVLFLHVKKRFRERDRRVGRRS